MIEKLAITYSFFSSILLITVILQSRQAIKRYQVSEDLLLKSIKRMTDEKNNKMGG